MPHDPTEAPAGYYAVPKSHFSREGGNLCRHCDWRPICNKPDTDLLAPGHRCMSHPILALRDGETYQRKDNTSVVFRITQTD